MKTAMHTWQSLRQASIYRANAGSIRLSRDAVPQDSRIGVPLIANALPFMDLIPEEDLGYPKASWTGPLFSTPGQPWPANGDLGTWKSVQFGVHFQGHEGFPKLEAEGA